MKYSACPLLYSNLTVWKPEPKVQWYDVSGNEITKSTEHYKISTTGKQTTLEICNIQVDDKGTYTLKVSNEIGEDKCEIPIQVADRPVPPGRPIVQDQNADSVKLLWATSMQDGGSPIRHYTVEMKKESDEKWSRAEIIKQPFTTLFNLVSGESYRFRVCADNIFGSSDPSEESESVYICDMTRAVVEPAEDETVEDNLGSTAIDYDSLTNNSEPVVYRTINVNRLRNDFKSKYIVKEELGRGAYGTVYRVIERATGKSWAAKVVQVRPGVKKEAVFHEIHMMNQLHHPKLLNLHEAFDLDTEMVLIEELVSGGELYEKIIEDDTLMAEEEVRDYVHQILLGVQYMHENNIVHLDLKPENILLKSNNSTDIKIIDFGLARKLDPNKNVKLLFGTPEFCAPEVVNFQPVGLSTDMWTVGVITYVLLSGLSPFLGENDEETLANVSAGDWDFDDPSWDDVSPLAKDFICRLMIKDKRRRMTVAEALQHPWIKGPLLSAFNDLSEYVKQTQTPTERDQIPLRQKRNFLARKRWSDDILPMGRLVKRGAIFRRLSMDGVFEREITFETEYAPKVCKQLEDIIAKVGDLIATLSCDVDGIPAPRITWFKDGKEILINNTTKYASQYSNGVAELHIKSINKDDSGVYKMEATNEIGSINSVATLSVEKTSKKKSVRESESRKLEGNRPAFLHNLSDKSVKLNEPLILTVTCSTLPEPDVQWFRNGEPIDLNSRKYILKHDKGRYELEILSCGAEDDAEWKVHGNNGFGECESSCKLTVEIPNDLKAPEFVTPLKDIICNEMEMLRLETCVLANPLPEITWYRNNDELYHGNHHSLIFDDQKKNYSLIVSDAYAEDSGNYRCVAKNSVGVAECSCFVTIKEAEIQPVKLIDDGKSPKFKMHLPNRAVPEGFELTLVCAVTGSPNPEIKWLKDDKEIDSTSNDMKYENGVCTFTIFSTTLKDAGVYSCVATNSYGTASSSCTVEIQAYDSMDLKPKFKQQLMDVSAIEGSEIVLECVVVGKPTPTVTWYKDGLKLFLENRMLQYTDRKGVSRLNIMNVLKDDSGEYSCEAVNKLGKDFTHCVVKIVGNRELLEVEVTANPKPYIEWYHNGKLIAESRTLRTYFDGRIAFLKVYEADEKHQGQYLCRATNKLGSAETRCTVVVSPRPGLDDQIPNMPKFLQKLQDISVKKEDDTVTLTCQVHGTPRPEVQWLFNGRAIHNNSNIRIRAFDDNVCTLQIARTSRDSCGTYTAVAHNIYGDAHSSANVVFLEQSTTVIENTVPKFIVEPPSKIVVEAGNILCITCDIDGIPEPEVTWFKDGHPIKNGHATIKKDSLTHQLLIGGVDNTDEGEYVVKAENVLGSEQRRITVEIINSSVHGEKAEISTGQNQMPEAPTGPLVAEEIETNNLVLHWGAPLENNIEKVNEYVVERRSPDEQHWIKIGTTAQATFRADKLASDAEYFFRVSAHSKIGWSKYLTTSSAIKTLPSGMKPVLSNIFPETLSINEMENFTIEASYSGKPQPVIKWYRNGMEIKANKSNVTIKTGENKSVLTVKKPKLGIDDGVYSCHAENDAGHAFKETTVIINSNEVLVDRGKNRQVPNEAPTIVKQLANVTVAGEQQFVLLCKVSGSIPYQVSWYKNDSTVSSCGRFQLDSSESGTYKLICHSAQVDDMGIYRCVLNNAVGIAQSSCKVNVTDKQGQKPPTFEKTLSDCTVIAGSEIKLKCRVIGNPDPQVVWMKDGEQLSTSRRITLRFIEDGYCLLLISNVNSSDTGIYLCSAKNVVGVDSTQAMLTVADETGPDRHLVTADSKEKRYLKPEFVRVPSSIIESSEGSTVKLIARAVGQPMPLITWKKDGKEITRGNPLYETRVTPIGESVLIISCVTVKTAGIFACCASNSEGTVESESNFIVHSRTHKRPHEEPPRFSIELVDTGVAIGHSAKLKCAVQGIPEPQVQWYFVDDSRKSTLIRSTLNSLWTEYRKGEICELRADAVVSIQQGTYQCVAVNEYGKALSQCYVLVGNPSDEPAGPPRFLRCLRDIWSPVGSEVVFEVEVEGHPLPELSWYHNDKKVVEDRTMKISYTSRSRCELRISPLSLKHLGSYSVVASNVHGVLVTSAALNASPDNKIAEPPKFLQSLQQQGIRISKSEEYRKFSEVTEAVVPDIVKLEKEKRLLKKEMKKGDAPRFIRGLEDQEFREGDVAALAGKLSRKHRSRVMYGQAILKDKNNKNLREKEGATHDSDATSTSESSTIEDVRMAIAERNKKICRPKFMVKPKQNKTIEENKSLRLKAAISGNPAAKVRWDKSGIVLETGNKYSIYHDGDFYYLEVHHMSKFDEGFYNCTASNSEGIATSTSEIIVVAPKDPLQRRSRKEPKAPSFLEVLPGKVKLTSNELFSVECSISAYPAPSISWCRNGNSFIPKGDRCMMLYDGETATLKIAGVTSADVGTYTCVAENHLGQAKTSMQLDVEQSTSESEHGIVPMFSTERFSEPIIACDGEKVVLSAELVEGSEPLSVIWMHDKVEISDSSGFTYSKKKNYYCMTIADAFPEDSGEYICEARNKFGAAQCFMNLHVSERSNKHEYEEPPEVIGAEKIVKVDPGNTICLNALVRGHPEPVIVWQRRGKMLIAGDRYEMKHQGEKFTLLINDATREDTGPYCLEAMNSAGTATVEIVVEVNEITETNAVVPKFVCVPISIQCAYGQKAELKCEFKGKPQPVVSWFLNDNKIVSGRQGYRIKTSTSASQLTVLRLKESHLGEYLCVIRNSYGEDLAKARIMLEGTSAALPPRR
uniref:Myosin light chain kinase, smooth muscle n=1 Tax=Syphacia muris TaxID=451379 RepID=A0A0N5ALN6_9BILA